MFIGSKEMAEILNIKTVTLRKYADVMEKAGYVVKRSANGRREYSEKDVISFRHLQELCQHSGMKLEAASKVIVSKENKALDAIAHTENLEKESQIIRYKERYAELQELIDLMKEQHHRQSEELAKLQEISKEQDEKIGIFLNEISEIKMMIATTTEKRKRKWKFWSKE